MPSSLNEVLATPTQSTVPAASAPAAPSSAPAAEQAPAPAQAAAPSIEGDTDEAATPAATSEETTPPEDPHPVPRAALLDERRKRQELERELAKLQGKLEAYSQTVKPPEAAPQPSPEDMFYRDPVAFVNTRVAQERLAISEELVRQQHDDYDDVVKAFVEAAHKAPHLVAQMQVNPNPARYAYQTGKAYLQARQYGSIDEMKTKIREELRAEVTEEVKRELAKQAASAVQPSLASARGTGTTAAPQWRGPTPLKQMFGR